MSESPLRAKLAEILSDSAIILEANRDVDPRKYQIALNLFLEDAIQQILLSIESLIPEEITAGSIEELIPANYSRTDNADTQRGYNACRQEMLDAIRSSK